MKAGDAEQVLLDHLAAVKRAVADGASAAPDLQALRNVIGGRLGSVTLVRSGTLPAVVGEGMVAWHDNVSTVEGGEPDRYWLLLMVRQGAVGPSLEPARSALPVEAGTPTPMGQATPVPCAGQYPSGFSNGSVLGGAIFAPIEVAP
jgi:hypothetical protein